MKLLYIIFLLALITGCSGDAEQPEAVGALPPEATIPAAWLTRPPTPVITPQSESLAPALTDNDTSAAAPVVAAEPEPLPTMTAGPPPTAVLGEQLRLAAADGVPGDLVAQAQQLAAARPEDVAWVGHADEPDLTLLLDEGLPLGQWVYAVAAPFATIEDEISLSDLQARWSDPAGGAGGPIVVSDEVLGVFTGLWGAPGGGVLSVPGEQLVATLWEQRPALTIVPFEELRPELKVLTVDGYSPLAPDFSLSTYPLAVRIGVSGEESLVAELLRVWGGPVTNRDGSKLTRLAMTGVTALVRATATQMEVAGILAPAADVGPVLQAADIAHISNEVPFAEDCPEPNPVGGTTFCSQPEYFALLEELGTDVVELTGNHVNDWGADSLLYTLDLYEAAGMATFGGGSDSSSAAEPALFEHNGNKIALTGCNPFGPSYAWATATSGGSRSCDGDFEAQIGRLRDEGYQVIVTQQFAEYYQYAPPPDQQAAFRRLAETGATAVSGSQGHHAQGFEFHDGAFIHYGLGNLFFDQMDMMGTRQAFVDTYAFYDGRLLNVELWTGLIEDYFKPRLMTPEERAQALQAVFQASGW